MRWLIDTNVLLRQVQPGHRMCSTGLDAIAELRRRGDTLHVGVQNLAEFRCVVTRPMDVNGPGWNPHEADSELERLEGLFILAPDDPGVYSAWRKLIAAHAVSGAQVHDARLVALMRVHGLTHILTFDTGDFRRYSEIAAMHPQDGATMS